MVQWHKVRDDALFPMWLINPTFRRQSLSYQHCESDKQCIYGEIVTITESNGSCCIIFLFEKKQEMAHYILKQINICSVLPLLHAWSTLYKELWNIQIYMRHAVGWNKHFLSANLLLRFLLCDKGNAIFISGLYVSGRLSNYKRWSRPLAIKAHIAAGNSCGDCFSKGCHIERNRCTWSEKRSVI